MFSVNYSLLLIHKLLCEKIYSYQQPQQIIHGVDAILFVSNAIRMVSVYLSLCIVRDNLYYVCDLKTVFEDGFQSLITTYENHVNFTY